MNKHKWHLVDGSPWPYVCGMGCLSLACGSVMWFHEYNYYLMIIGLILIVLTMFIWWGDIIREAYGEGSHHKEIEKSLKLGMILFITSEVIFFFSFFWSFFHSSLAPVVEIGWNWPPLGIVSIKAFDVPLLNTSILLTSAISLTWSHYSFINHHTQLAKIALSFTVFLGVLFTLVQAIEYYQASFSLADSVFGSVFFVATGFHGLHVIIGTVFLIFTLFRLYKKQFSFSHHLGFEASAWYWHFVDYVWLFLFLCIYSWGS